MLQWIDRAKNQIQMSPVKILIKRCIYQDQIYFNKYISMLAKSLECLKKVSEPDPQLKPSSMRSRCALPASIVIRQAKWWQQPWWSKEKMLWELAGAWSARQPKDLFRSWNGSCKSISNISGSSHIQIYDIFRYHTEHTMRIHIYNILYRKMLLQVKCNIEIPWGVLSRRSFSPVYVKLQISLDTPDQQRG